MTFCSIKTTIIFLLAMQMALSFLSIRPLFGAEVAFSDSDYQESGTRYVVMFAASEFERSDLLDSLPGSSNDMFFAKKNWLDCNPCFKSENIFFLHNNNQSDTNMLPTRDNFYRVVDSLLEKMMDQDSIYILISTHGVAFNDCSFICPSDTLDIDFSLSKESGILGEISKSDLQKQTIQKGIENGMIPIKELIDKLQKAEIAGRFLIIDSCREDRVDPDAGTTESDFLQEFQDTLRNNENTGLAIITSCSLKQRAHHIDLGENTYGAFMYFFINGLRGNADLTGAYDSRITLVEAYNYANIRTREYTRVHYNDEQTPEFFEASVGKVENNESSSVYKDMNQTVLACYESFPKNQHETDLQFVTRTGSYIARDSSPNYDLVVRIFNYVIENQPNNVLARSLRAYSARALGNYELSLADQISTGGSLRLFVKAKGSRTGAYVYASATADNPITINNSKMGFFAGDQVTIDRISGTRVHIDSYNNKPPKYSCWMDRDAVSWDKEIARTSIIGTDVAPARNYNTAPPTAPTGTTPYFSPSGGGGGPSINI